jgi:chromate reductase
MILILAGTNRPRSATRRVADLAADAHRQANPARQVRVLDLFELPLDSFSPLSYAEKPAALIPFLDAVVHAAALVVVTPEYNGSFPGVLKYFIDLLPFPAVLERKPVCFVGVADGQWGALRAVEQLQQIFAYQHALMLPDRVFIPRVGDALHTGALASEYQQRLAQQATHFQEFVTRHTAPA